jgi:hypothetical protein
MPDLKQMKKYFIIKNLLAILAIGLGLVALCFLNIMPAQGQNQESISLVWTTDTWVPNDYLGRALPILGSRIEVFALADNKIYASKDLIFNWYLNGQYQKSDSGPGKNTLSFSVRKEPKENVRLSVEKNHQTLYQRSLDINIVKPQIFIYSQLNPSAALKNFVVKNNETAVFFSQPYFFNFNNPDDLQYTWMIGSQKAQEQTGQKSNVLNLETSYDQETFTKEIYQNLNLSVQNKLNEKQTAQFKVPIKILP